MAHEMETFEQWFKRMANRFEMIYHVSLMDMVDIDYRSIYEDGGSLVDIIDTLREQDDLFAEFASEFSDD